jgi:hypothetical protein
VIAVTLVPSSLASALTTQLVVAVILGGMAGTLAAGAVAATWRLLLLLGRRHG